MTVLIKANQIIFSTDAEDDSQASDYYERNYPSRTKSWKRFRAETKLRVSIIVAGMEVYRDPPVWFAEFGEYCDNISLEHWSKQVDGSTWMSTVTIAQEYYRQLFNAIGECDRETARAVALVLKQTGDIDAAAAVVAGIKTP